MTRNQLQVETRGSELILTRQFDAPRVKVFKAHTDCEHLKHWFRMTGRSVNPGQNVNRMFNNNGWL